MPVCCAGRGTGAGVEQCAACCLCTSDWDSRQSRERIAAVVTEATFFAW